MSRLSMNTVINAPAGAVWKTISDFNGAGKYVAAIANSTMEGSGVGAIRTLTLEDGAKIVERLESLDEQAMTLSYSITESPLPLERYVSTMQIRELGENGCKLQWSCTFEPEGASEAEAKNVVEGVYSMGSEGLKKLHGG